MTLKGALVLALPLCLVVAIGCDKANPHAPASVSGKVTYKGEPVTGGTITFHPKTEGPSPTTTINADGTYTITDSPAGDFTVTVETESINPSKKAPQYPGAGKAGGATTSSPMPGSPPTAAAGKYVKIPQKYADPKTSTLTAKLGAGKQTVNFTLED
jgi:hypothetical protein